MFFGGDPFDHFGHGGPRGGGGRRPSANVDTTKLYETLGVRVVDVVMLSIANELVMRAAIHLC